MIMQVVKLDERTRVKGLVLLPGSQLEFDTVGQANSFVYRYGGSHVKQQRSSAGSTGNPEKDPGTKSKTRVFKSSKADAAAGTE